MIELEKIPSVIVNYDDSQACESDTEEKGPITREVFYIIDNSEKFGGFDPERLEILMGNHYTGEMVNPPVSEKVGSPAGKTPRGPSLGETFHHFIPRFGVSVDYTVLEGEKTASVLCITGPEEAVKDFYGDLHGHSLRDLAFYEPMQER